MRRHITIERPLVWWMPRVKTDLGLDDLVMSTLVVPVFTFDYPGRDELSKHVAAPRGSGYYILERKAVVESDVLMWAFWRNIDDRRVARTDLGGGYSISTVFLGMNHGWSETEKDAVVFESMVFDAQGNDAGMRRYCTWAEAEQGHAELVEIWNRPEMRYSYEMERDLETPPVLLQELDDSYGGLP